MEPISTSDLQQMFAEVAAAGTYGCFEYQGISVGFYTDEPDLLDWFSKFFGGYFTVTAGHTLTPPFTAPRIRPSLSA